MAGLDTPSLLFTTQTHTHINKVFVAKSFTNAMSQVQWMNLWVQPWPQVK